MMHLLAQAEPQKVARVEWLNLPESWQVFVFLLVVVAIIASIIFLYVREMNVCPMPVKLVLAFLRCTVAALLIIAFLKPSITYVEQRTRKPNVVLLRDSSQSMSIEDKFRDDPLADRVASAIGVSVDDVQEGTRSRAQIIDSALRYDNGAVLNQLREKAAVRVVHFAGEIEPLVTLPAYSDENRPPVNETTGDAATEFDEDAEPNKHGLPDLEPIGSRTDIWQALKSALNVGQLHAIVLASDGQHTSPDLPTEIAEYAAELKIPIHVVGVGDPRRTRNVAVADVWVLSKARPNEPFEIDFLITGQDVRGQTVEVELLKQTVDSNTGELGTLTSVASMPLTFEEESGNLRDQFEHFEEEVGSYRYTIRVSDIADEEESGDNSKVSGQVDVTKNKVKVLLIAGAPTWEYRMVQRLLQRDQNITLSCWLQTMDPERPQEGNEPIAILPRTYEQLAEYNVVMLFDPNPDEFDTEWMEALKRFSVDKAGGVLYMAGPKYTSLFLSLRRTAAIKDIVPVEFAEDGNSEVAQLLASSSTTASNLQIVIQNIDHQVLRFPGDRNENLTLWQNMPGIYWSYPARRAKPTTQTLVEHSDITLSADGENSRPLMVAGRYGAGNTLYLGFNGTWRWRRVGRQAEFFDRFWIQVCNYLVNTRSIQGLRRGTVDSDRETYELGDTIEFAARLLDPRYEPLGLAEVPGQLKIGEGQVIPLTLYMVPGQEGNYRATFPASRVGQFELQVDLPGANEEQKVDPVSVRVEPPKIETRATWLNEPLLREIADKSGGKYFEIDELSLLADELQPETTSVEWKSLPEPVWSINRILRIACFVLPVILLGLEWAIRKGFKLL